MEKETILLWRETGILVHFGEEGSQAGGLREREKPGEGEKDCVGERKGHRKLEHGKGSQR